MRICVPSIGTEGMEENVAGHFGMAPFFTIVDTEPDSVEVVPNTSEHMGGVGKPPEILADAGVDILLCSGLGRRAFHIFRDSGLKVYVGASGTVKDTIEAWKQGKLEEATEDSACPGHHG